VAEPVNRDELQTLIHNGAQLIEVLGSQEYEYAHIPEAINIPLTELNRQTAAVLIRDRMVIFYCHDSQ
jgi:rhodanese-related sulfurtransferase